MGRTSDYLVSNLHNSLAYALGLAHDIPPGRFCEKPGPTVNHPAWCFGHLSIYPDRILPLVDKGDLVDPDERFDELFAAGTECVDDPTAYPTKQDIMLRFEARHRAMLDILPTIPEDVLDRETPVESLRSRMPTVGHFVAFLFGPHLMCHLGQVSTWRRVVGLGPAAPQEIA